MTTKLNSFILKDETINLMKDLLERTSETGLEHGFDLCLNPKTRKLTVQTAKCCLEILV